jgi:hypothetical protein
MSYGLRRDPGRVRMLIDGGGSWPAPGVVIPVSEPKGYALIGSARMCVTEVEVRPSPDSEQAVLVGDETWFLSRDACMRSRSASLIAHRGCSDLRKNAQPGKAVVPGEASDRSE